MIRESVIGTPNVDIDTFGGLLADYVRDRKATAVVRGVRTGSELSEEWPSAMMNRQLYDEFETVFLIPSIDVAHISSRLVREIARLGGSVDGLVPPPVASRLATLGRPRTTDRA
jgi:pantetheine-phosphate adenylyltransferase